MLLQGYVWVCSVNFLFPVPHCFFTLHMGRAQVSGHDLMAAMGREAKRIYSPICSIAGLAECSIQEISPSSGELGIGYCSSKFTGVSGSPAQSCMVGDGTLGWMSNFLCLVWWILLPWLTTTSSSHMHSNLSANPDFISFRGVLESRAPRWLLFYQTPRGNPFSSTSWTRQVCCADPDTNKFVGLMLAILPWELASVKPVVLSVWVRNAHLSKGFHSSAPVRKT